MRGERKKQGLKDKYLEERRVAKEREKWKNELEEEAFRSKVRRGNSLFVWLFVGVKGLNVVVKMW